jgi:3-oxoacyl-[acyl-carrier protein] reductase
MSLAGKVALITGGSKGIGRATAFRLAKDGASVVINYSSDKASADEVVNSIGADKCLAIQGDAGSVKFITELVEQAVSKFGKIDILVPMAGILPMSPLEATTEELFDKVFNLNVKGPFFLCQVCETQPLSSISW